MPDATFLSSIIKTSLILHCQLPPTVTGRKTAQVMDEIGEYVNVAL